MKISLVGPIMGAAIVGIMALPSSVVAKTAKECRAEWTANKTANQAKGVSEKAYVAQCRAETSAEKVKPTGKENAASKMAAPATAEKKTEKECRAEWTANKAANQAKGITEKAYVANCRAGAAMSLPAPPTAPTTAAKPMTPAKTAAPAAAEKTVKACEDEWRANKAANEANGITEKAYVAECRSGATTMKQPAAPAPDQTKVIPPENEPKRTNVAPPSEPTKRTKSTARTESPGIGKPEGANQYAAEGQAKAHCPSGLVVWANLDSKIYHFAGHSDYGHTKQGAYMCEKDAASQGIRAAKDEKHP